MYSVIVPGAHLMPALLGQRDVNLRAIEQAFPAATIVVRGNEITIDGPQAELVSRLFEELVVLLQEGQHSRRACCVVLSPWCTTTSGQARC